MDLWSYKELKYLVYYSVFTLCLSLFLLIFGINFLDTLQVCFVLIYVLVIPGYLFTLIFFRNQELDIIERTALTFAFSIAIITLTIIFTNNVLTIPFTSFSNFLIVGILIIILLTIELIITKHEKE